jgi:predicted ATPase/class 3 adenylate cyclase
MTSLPAGTVTFLFTDIESSTKLAQQYPDAMPDLLARHHEILSQSIQAHNGYVFQIVGDSFSAAFHSAGDALNAALDAQRLLHNEVWSPAPIKVRMGIHTGAAQLMHDSLQTAYSGYTTLALTQRIMSAGHGGQILISGATRELVRDTLPTGIRLVDLGERRLKDLLRPEHLYQLSTRGLPATFPSLRTLDSFPNNLPVQLTTFIGRENEIAELKQDLDEHRLVTLTGSGGTGKTRLSLQVAAELLEKFAHGVWFVELAPLTDPDLIPQTILSALGINEQKGMTPLELLKEYLHEKQTLIVLDNCEHLVSASAQTVNALLSAAPKIKILATSREALGVTGELSYPVPSLSLPDPKHLLPIEQLSQFEAVRLFIDRTLLVAPHFIVDKDNAPFIAQICHRLDGIPLALELAAARVKMMSVYQISTRLDDRFRLLTGGARTALPRQQTLRALIDWSYDILTESERLLLRRLSVFAGGWTLEAAEEVCVAQDDISSYDVLELLTQLVNKSLVVVMEHPQSGETRYRMLETVRQYAREKLLEAGGSEIVRDLHLTYFARLAERAEPELYRSNQLFWLNRLDDELDNLRMALEWALATNIESGLRVTASWRFWEARGHIQEMGEWLPQLLERYNAADLLRIRAMVIYGVCLVYSHDYVQSRMIAEQSLQLARSLSNKQAEAFSLWGLGAITTLQGDYGQGMPMLERSLALYQSLGETLGQAMATGWLSGNIKDLERSKALVRESLRLYRELGDLSGIAGGLRELAIRTIWGGDISSPAPWLEEARSIYRQLGDQSGEASVLDCYGTLAFWQGDYQQACAYYEESIVLAGKVGSYVQSSWTSINMAYASLRQGDTAKAEEMFVLWIQRVHRANSMDALIYAMEGLASLRVSQKQIERAARLFAWTDAMREKLGNNNPPVERASIQRDLALIHSQMSDAAFEHACASGKALTLEQAIALAVER